MKNAKRYLISFTGALLLASAGTSAQTVVNETSAGDLQVVNYSGKPPFKRQLIQADDRASYPMFNAIEDSVLISTSSKRRTGAPGKSLPAQVARVERVAMEDISNITRFEEVESNRSTRMWRGAPGKGRRLAR